MEQHAEMPTNKPKYGDTIPKVHRTVRSSTKFEITTLLKNRGVVSTFETLEVMISVSNNVESIVRVDSSILLC